MEHLTQEDLKRMILFSYERVERDKDQINKINVFPVPDQDTGNNLAATLKGIRETIKDREFKGPEEFSSAVLDGALTFAQGNAGIIYTGFLAGFLSDFNQSKIDVKKLSLAFEKGAERARQSIQHPKAGTILDVIDAARDSLKEESEKEKNIIIAFKKMVEGAQAALMATREKMEIFRKANVVDAGGLGFLMILESYVDALNNKEPSRLKIEENKSSEKVKRIIQILSNRYEIVSLIEGPKMEEKEIRNKLKTLGNCLDIVKVGDRIKIHIHTDFPDEAKNVMRGIGQIQSLRIEDMAKEVVGEESVKKVSIGIITDELADLTQKIVERYKIEVVPFKVVWKEGEKLRGENLYQKMKEAERSGIKKLPTTSQPSPKDFADVFKKQLSSFEKVLCISFSSKLSGGYNSACQAKTLLESNSIYNFDSLNASAGQALLVLRAIELIQSQTEINEVIEELNRESLKIHLCGIPADPKWL
jgi:dihydroxyacetone kinase-like predicted kinase